MEIHCKKDLNNKKPGGRTTALPNNLITHTKMITPSNFPSVYTNVQAILSGHRWYT